ncbi:MAG: methyltransferase [Candidatus Bathyarchaeota archaeon]|nr:methyltransferase [Candidatus Bathyarchaeota archaeon]
MSNHYFSPDPSSKLEKGLIESVLRGRKYRFVTASGVFSAKRIDTGTRILVEAMELPEEGAMLDMGCGIGVIGIVAAVENPSLFVTMTDVNSRATQLAGENVERMKLTNVEVLTGDIYEPVGERKFNVIVSNPPISAGMRKVVEPIVRGAAEHLEAGGSLQMVVQSNKGGRTLMRYLEEYLSDAHVLKRQGGYRVLAARKS